MKRHVSAWSCALAAALALATSAAAAPVPLAKARAVAARRLFDYVWPLSYVTDYAVTGCTRTAAGAVSCAYRVAFAGGGPCTGTILVGRAGRSVTSRFSGDLCGPPDAPAGDAAGPPPPGSTTPVPAPVATAPVDPAPAPMPPTTPTAPPAPAYGGLGGTHALDGVTGEVVELDDGSSWRVDGDVSGWIYEDVIEVAYANGVYTLTDANVSPLPVGATYLG